MSIPNKPFTIALASCSPLKYRAVKEAFAGYAATRGKELVIKTFSMEDLSLPEQPVNSGAVCAKKRVEYLVQQLTGDQEFDLWIAIESGIVYDRKNDPVLSMADVKDVAFVHVLDSENRFFSDRSIPISVPGKYLASAWDATPKNYSFLPPKSKYHGFSETVGAQIEKKYRNIAQTNMMLTSFIASNDWMAHPDFGGISRVDQIKGPLGRIRDAVELASMKNLLILKVPFFERKLPESLILKVPFFERKLPESLILKPDFPKPGVLFQGLDRILADPVALSVLKRLLVKYIEGHYETRGLKIAGISSRGYIYGMLLSGELLPSGGGFIKIAKKGKLPGKTLSVDYGTEYSSDTIEILPEVISKGDSVLIIDDLVATGGSLAAAAELVHKAGGIPVGCLSILQVPSLVSQARNKLSKLSEKIGREIPLHVLLPFAEPNSR